MKTVLYRLPALLEADQKATVVIVEGEKDVDRLRSLEYIATCNRGGAGKWDPDYSAALSGRRVVVIPDADDDRTGLKHAEAVAGALQGIAESVSILELPDAKDVSAFFDRGGTTDQLDRLLEEAPVWVPMAEATVDAAAPRSARGAELAATQVRSGVNLEGFQSPGEVLASVPLPKYRFPTVGFESLNASSRGGLPTGAVIVFSGWPDAGKTGLATQIAVDIAMNNDVVLTIFTPDGGREASAIRIGGLLGLDQDKLESRDPGELAAFDAKLKGRGIFIVNDSVDGMVLANIRTKVEAYRPDLTHVYVLDSAQECLATDGDDEKDERHRVISLMRIAYDMADANPVPTLVLITSQVAGSAFAPRKRDRTAPIGAPAESKKISFLCHMIVTLEGDPSKAPAYGRGEVTKSKLRGPKPTFGLIVDPVTSRLREVPLADLEDEKKVSKAQDANRAREDRVAKIWPRAQALLTKHGPLLVSDIRERLGVDVKELRDALDGAESRGEAAWEKAGKTGQGRSWRALGLGES